MSPTLAELNTDPPRAKRPAYSASYSPPPHTHSAHPYSTAVSDSSATSLPPPTIAFGDREGLDELSSSFKSLYKSMFGQSVSDGTYINADILPHIPTQELGCSSDSSSINIPFGASATGTDLLSDNKGNHVEFLNLMDSFRDIANAKTWDELDPAHIQGLLESFKAGQRDKFGLDSKTYANVHASFNQFVSQLSNRFVTVGNPSGLNNYSQHPPIGHHNGHHNYQVDTLSPMQLGGGNHSSPLAFNHSPGAGAYRLYNTPTVSSLAVPQQPNSLKTDLNLFDDVEDDFDWSKLM